MMGEARELAQKARLAAPVLATMGVNGKNAILTAMAEGLMDSLPEMMAANQMDVAAAEAKGQTRALLDRLILNEKRISAMAQGLRDIAALPDPVGEVLQMWVRPNGLRIGKMRVPLGVIGIIYEARPNVTVDAAGLCLKSGNAVILRGGSEAIHSNKAIIQVLNDAGKSKGMPEGAVSLIQDTSREAAAELMALNGLVDVLIPRGGAGLIRSVVENARVPVIETGVGNCHIYVDGDSDREMAIRITVNAKTSRPAVCNAAETLLVDKTIAVTFLPACIAALQEKGVEIRGCPETRKIVPQIKAATEEDWYEEYLDYIMAVKVVDGVDEAIRHINQYGSKHSEAIVTNDYANANRFHKEVDAAAVYVNASTRFTDGYEFGFGAEIGISTQKLHARGPMGLAELTSYKYIIFGEGQIR